jgi:hypothetical protein
MMPGSQYDPHEPTIRKRSVKESHDWDYTLNLTERVNHMSVREQLLFIWLGAVRVFRANFKRIRSILWKLIRWIPWLLFAWIVWNVIRFANAPPVLFRAYTSHDLTSGVQHWLANATAQYLINHPDVPCVSSLEVSVDYDRPYYHVALRSPPHSVSFGSDVFHMLNPEIRFPFRVDGSDVSIDQDGHDHHGDDRDDHASKARPVGHRRIEEENAFCDYVNRHHQSWLGRLMTSAFPLPNRRAQPAVTRQVLRANEVRVAYHDLFTFKRFEHTVSGAHAYCLQHYEDVFRGAWSCDPNGIVPDAPHHQHTFATLNASLTSGSGVRHDGDD